MRRFCMLVIVLAATLPVSLVVMHCRRPEAPVLAWGGPRNISMLLLVADDHGWLDREGLTTRAENIQTGKLAMEALQGGSLDLAVLVDSNLAFAGFQENPGFHAIATIQEKWDDAILYRADSNIRMPSDLRGASLGTPLGTTAHVFASFFLAKHGIPYESVTFVNQTPPGIQAALIQGDMKVASIWQPFRYNVEQELGTKVSTFSDPSVYTAFAVLAARDEVIASRRPALLKILEALRSAQEEISDDLAKAQAALAPKVGLSRDVLANNWKEYRVRLGPPSVLQPLLQREGKWIIDTQKSYEHSTPPNYDQLIDSSLFAEFSETR